MTASIYLHPIGLSNSPQAESTGDGPGAIRLAGSMVYASRFALVVREGGKVVHRRIFALAEAEGALAEPGGTLAAEATRQWANLQKVHAPLQLGERTIRLDQPQIMGVLNVTPDSFSDGGEWLEKPDAGRAHAASMLEAGAAIIDIGGESTRPGGAATFEGDEIERVVPAVEYCAAMGAAISVDTRRAGVLEAALSKGAHMANDVSAMRYDPRMVELVASAGCPVILMHAPGTGEDLHSKDGLSGGDYTDVVSDVFDTLKHSREKAIASGIAEDRIMIDPGIGFGKTLGENLALINALPLFHSLGSPLLLGMSRKRMIGALSREEGAHERLGGSIALAMAAMNAGAHMLRVHDVAETVQARNVWRGMRDAALTDFSTLPQ
ncbi:dihydropteroate synthase [Erythrobacter sp. SCSIO 43205]|uniref:dihydropteroate synthase n=1 Tax=Erythrobacter sp. SCSIO 43205 TaxID=2779361 RepID=UPI001CA8A6D3|nr:dihydropteroate synthase [Erythrobacter sp. SCSIO 43205]UAB79434.1 dihydropteroate synthase [Erythrobacter sp. SCSIO 43205]